MGRIGPLSGRVRNFAQWPGKHVSGIPGCFKWNPCFNNSTTRLRSATFCIKLAVLSTSPLHRPRLDLINTILIPPLTYHIHKAGLWRSRQNAPFYNYYQHLSIYLHYPSFRIVLHRLACPIVLLYLSVLHSHLSIL